MKNSEYTSKIWALFESGESITIGSSLHSAPKDKSRPIDAYIVSEAESSDFTRAARRAAEAVYKNRRPYFHGKGPVSVAFDLQSHPPGVAVAGASGGLAFAIALAAKIYQRDTVTVAATGEIVGVGESDSIGPVRGITAKLEAAYDVLPKGGWVLYPRDNDQDISDILRTKLIKKGLRLRPVSSVTQALQVLFLPAGKRQKTNIRASSKRKAIWLGGLLAFFCIAAAASMWLSDWEAYFSNRAISQITDTEPIGKETPKGSHTDEKQATATSQIASPDSVIVNIKSDSPLMGNVEMQLSDQLTEHLTRQYASKGGHINVTGKIATVNIIEGTDTVTGELQSEIRLELENLVLEDGEQKKIFSPLAVRVTGRGSAGSLAGDAAEKLFRKILDALASQIETGEQKRKLITEGEGFD